MDVLEICIMNYLFSVLTSGSKMIAVRTNVYPSHRDTSIWLNYCKLNKEPLQQTSHFLFEVKSCKEIRVILAESFDTLRPSSEIIIGKEMTYSRIRYCNSFPCGNETMSDEETPDVLDCASFKQFWISWKSELSFGQGHVVGEKTIMTKDLRNKINHLGLQTISGNSDQWIVYEDTTIFDMTNDDLCIETYIIGIQSTALSKDIIVDTTLPNVISIKELDYVSNSNIDSCTCACSSITQNPWSHLSEMNLTIDQTKSLLEKRLDEIRMEIEVNPKRTSRYNTTKTSASDDRFSAKVAGWIGGCIIAIVPCFIVVTDILKYCL